MTDPVKLREAFQRIVLQGTSDNPEGYGPPFKAPWFVIDSSKADPDVGWPGELISEHDFPDEADDARWRAIAEIIDTTH